MEMRIQFTPELPPSMTLDDIKQGLDTVLEEDGWLIGSGQDAGGAYIELELEDQRRNPKYGILAVKNYLQTIQVPRSTALEMAGLSIGVYE